MTTTTNTTCLLEWCDGELHDPNGCESGRGGWHCITCHTTDIRDNMMARNHAFLGHEVGWSCGEHLRIEGADESGIETNQNL